MSAGYDTPSPSIGCTAAGTRFFFRAKSRTQMLFATRRPWQELFAHPASYSIPSTAMIILFILCLSLLYDPTSMVVLIIVSVFWFLLYFFRSEPIVVIGLGLVTIVSLVLMGVWLNVLVSVLIGAAVVVLHAAFWVTEDLFLDEDEVADGGLLSVVGAGYNRFCSTLQHLKPVKFFVMLSSPKSKIQKES